MRRDGPNAEALALEQLAALRDTGMSQIEALDLVAEGLPAGPLRERVASAALRLAAGEHTTHDPLLCADSSPDALRLAAAAVEARQDAVAAFNTIRLILAVLVAFGAALMPLTLLVSPDLNIVFGGGKALSSPRNLVLAALSCAGLLETALWMMPRLLARWTPGVALLDRASRLFHSAATGTDPLAELKGAVERDYFVIRRDSLGARSAAAELGDELARRGRRRSALALELIPLVVVSIAAPLSTALWFFITARYALPVDP